MQIEYKRMHKCGLKNIGPQYWRTMGLTWQKGRECPWSLYLLHGYWLAKMP